MLLQVSQLTKFKTSPQKGPALARGLAEIVEKRPSDPVEYLAHFLHKFVKNKIEQEKVRFLKLTKKIIFNLNLQKLSINQ